MSQHSSWCRRCTNLPSSNDHRAGQNKSVRPVPKGGVPYACMRGRRSSAARREPRPRHRELRFIEVKGRVEGADTVTVTKNEILYSLNKQDPSWRRVPGRRPAPCPHLRQLFQREPDFEVTS